MVTTSAISPREQEVLNLLVEGLTNIQIGASLSITPSTAKQHVSNVLAKTQMQNRTQLACYWQRIQLQTLEDAEASGDPAQPCESVTV